MAFTSGHSNAGSDGSHAIEIQAKGYIRTVELYDLPEDDMEENKGDLWHIDFNSFGFPGCVLPTEITKLSVVATNDDGWNIDSIMTIGFMDTDEGIFLTADYDVYRWIDGDGSVADE